MTLHMIHSFLINHVLEICDLQTFQYVPRLFYDVFEDYVNLVDVVTNHTTKTNYVPRFRFSYVIYKNPNHKCVQLIYNKSFQLRLNNNATLKCLEYLYNSGLSVHDYDDYAMNKVMMVANEFTMVRIGRFLCEGIPKVKMKA